MYEEPTELTQAKDMLKAGEPVPVDLIFRLTEMGIDFSELEDRYANAGY